MGQVYFSKLTPSSEPAGAKLEPFIRRFEEIE